MQCEDRKKMHLKSEIQRVPLKFKIRFFKARFQHKYTNGFAET